VSGLACAGPSAPCCVALGELLVHTARYLERSGREGERFACYNTTAFNHGRPALLGGAELRGKLMMVRPGDVLISRATTEPRRAWVVVERSGCTPLASGEWLVVRASDHDPGYLRHLLVSNEFHLRFQQAAAGSRQASAASAQLRALELPRPPQPQQQAVARLLDAADALRAKRRRALSALDALEAAWHEPDLTQHRAAAEALRVTMIASRARLDALLGVLRDRAYRGELIPPG
jgi:type I restriction enzyme, S subunit